MKFMIVDDNYRMRQMIRRNIEETVHGVSEFVECEDGLDALLHYGTDHPDWVLMDIEMRGMDGIVSSGLIKRNFPEAKIIMLTQYDDEEYRELARKIGVMDYLLKDQIAKIREVVNR